MSNEGLDLKGPFLVAAFLAALAYIFMQKYQEEITRVKQTVLSVKSFLFAVNWKTVGITLVVLIVLWCIVRYIARKVKEKKWKNEKARREIEYEKSRLEKLLATKWENLSSEEIILKLKDVKKSIKTIDADIRNELQEKIREFYKTTRKLISQKIQQEDLERQRKWEAEEKEKQKEEAEEKKIRMEVEELLTFKKERKDAEAIPVNKVYSNRAMSEAKIDMRNILDEKNKRKWTREEAIEYYKIHDVNTKPSSNDEYEEKIWAEVRQEIQEGKLKLKKELPEYRGEKLPKDFYRVEDLDEEEKRMAKAQGFRHVRSNELDGYVRGGGFYIHKENPRETKYHFCTKNLFAEIHPNMHVEEEIDGRRVDVVFYLGDFKLGIEIETGVNRKEYLAKKISWLDKNFHQWIFVCPKRHQKTYDKLVDNKKSFCMTPKRTKEWIEEMLLSEGEPIDFR